MNPDQIIIFDTTLRDGEQAPGAAMTMNEKVRIARQLARLNVDVIEAGFPVSSPGQFEAVQQIVSAVQGPTICALARAVEGDIRAAGEALASGANTRIHTFIATSDIHIDAKFGDARFGATLGDKRQTILRMIKESVAYARSFTNDVEFSAEDAGRTDHGFLREAVQTAVDAGATTINIPDTTGYCIPSEYAALFRHLMDALGDDQDVILSTHCHDDLGLAVANSLAAVRAGARQIECTINGIGERAGNASLEEVVMAIRVRNDLFGGTTRIEARELAATSQMVSVACGFPVPPNKAIVGRNAFSHEAGIHQHGVLKRRDTYEIMSAEDVGQVPEQIRLGRHSGRHGFFSRLEKLGVKVQDTQKSDLYKAFVTLADRKKEIYDSDLLHLVEQTQERAPEVHFSLESLRVEVAANGTPMAEVQVAKRGSGVVKTEQAGGDGPVDAIYRAIDYAVGDAHELVSYDIHSVSTGADAVGEVTVLVRFAGTTFRGYARSTDVLRASADAYLEAINKMEAFRTDEENLAFVGRGIIESFQ